MKIRLATPQDSDRLLAIYSQYIGTSVTFEYELPTQKEFAERIAGVVQMYPYLVLEEGGRAVGYAYAHRQMERAAYQWNATLSVYVEREHVGHGAGRALYGALLDLLTLQGIRNVYGCVTAPNPPSDALHAAFGFRLLGEFPASGYKLGAWHGIRWYGRTLAAPDAAPGRLLSVREVLERWPDETQDILRRHAAVARD